MNNVTLNGSIYLFNGESLAVNTNKNGAKSLTFRVMTKDSPSSDGNSILCVAYGEQAEYLMAQHEKDNRVEVILNGKIRSYKTQQLDGDGFPIYNTYVSILQGLGNLECISRNVVIERSVPSIPDEDEKGDAGDDSKEPFSTAPEMVKPKAGRKPVAA